MKCRKGCAACCIDISISSSIPKMPNGKIAGARCLNLNEDNSCKIYNTKHYPKVCNDFIPIREMCGETNEHAASYLKELEELTS